MASKQKKKRAFDANRPLEVLNIPTIQGSKIPGTRQMQELKNIAENYNTNIQFVEHYPIVKLK
jgi:hypothetical protein